MVNTILQELLGVREGIGLCWVGNAGWLVRGEGKLMAFDLDLERESLLRESPVSSEELAPVLDVAFVTHGHGDHFGERSARALAERSRCTFVLPANCVERGKGFGIPDSRIVVARPREPMEVAGIKVEPQRALHGHTNFSVYRGANLDDCGYVITLCGRKVFEPGDTVLLQDHVEDLADVSVLFVSPTLHNMHIAGSKTLIEAIRPDYVFPQHFDTYKVTEQNGYWTVGYPDELRASLSPEMQRRFHRLEQGTVFRIAPQSGAST